MKCALISDPLQRDMEEAASFLAENGFAEGGKMSRAEYRRQKHQKETVYHLTKSQIDAIKRQAVDEVTDKYKDIDQKIRNEYERQLNERYLDMQQQLNDRRIRDINFVIPAALKACHDCFGWKVYKGDQYQQLLIRLCEIFETESMTLVEIRRWVYKNLGIELKEVISEGEDD